MDFAEETTRSELFKEGIELKRVCLFKVDFETLSRICEKHSSIKKFKVLDASLGNEAQQMISSTLQHLITLQIIVAKYENQDLTFMQGLKYLKHLNLECNGKYGKEGGYNFLNINLESKHGLEELFLKNFAQSNSNVRFFNWFEKFPNLKTVKITDCNVNNWATFFDQINALENLKNLELNNVNTRYQARENSKLEKLSNIEILTINKCNQIPSDVLVKFLESCSRNTEAIYFQNMVPVDENIQKVLLSKAKSFGSFSLNKFCVTPDSPLEEIDYLLTPELTST